MSSLDQYHYSQAYQPSPAVHSPTTISFSRLWRPTLREYPNIPDTTYSAGQLRAAKHFLESMEQHGNILAAYLTGGLAVGLGNRLSDIDLIGVVRAGSRMPVANVHWDGYEIDFDPVGEGDFALLTNAAQAFTATMVSRHQIDMPDVKLQRLIRLANAIPLRAGPDLEAQRSSISRPVLRQILTTRLCAVAASGPIEDVRGATDSYDWLTALAASEVIVRIACDTLLVAHDDLHRSPKFLFRRLMRHGGTRRIAQEAWDLLVQTSFGADQHAIRSLLARRLAFASRILSFCAISAYDPLLSHISLYSVPNSSKGPRRNPYYTLIRFSDGFALRGPSCGFELSPIVAEVWALLDGSTVNRIVSRFQVGHPEEVQLERTVHESLKVLHERSLIDGITEPHFASLVEAATTGCPSRDVWIQESTRFFLGHWVAGVAN